MPEEDGALSAHSHNELLVGRHADLRDVARVAHALVVANALVVVPHLHHRQGDGLVEIAEDLHLRRPRSASMGPSGCEHIVLPIPALWWFAGEMNNGMHTPART